MDSASCEAVARKARLAGNGPALGKRRNAADDGFTTRPQGAGQTIQARVAVPEKDRAISCGRRLVLSRLAGSESINITLLEY
jgi:hypothetical protein